MSDRTPEALEKHRREGKRSIRQKLEELFA
jgi:hypothetical protein